MDLLKDTFEDGAVIKTDRAAKLVINDVTQTLPIYQARLDLLYYNDQNDRIATWLSQYKTEHDDQRADIVESIKNIERQLSSIKMALRSQKTKVHMDE